MIRFKFKLALPLQCPLGTATLANAEFTLPAHTPEWRRIDDERSYFRFEMIRDYALYAQAGDSAACFAAY